MLTPSMTAKDKTLRPGALLKFSQCKNVPSFSFSQDGQKRIFRWWRCPEETFAILLEETAAASMFRPPMLSTMPSAYLKILIGESVILVAREEVEFVVVQ